MRWSPEIFPAVLLAVAILVPGEAAQAGGKANRLDDLIKMFTEVAPTLVKRGEVGIDDTSRLARALHGIDDAVRLEHTTEVLSAKIESTLRLVRKNRPHSLEDAFQEICLELLQPRYAELLRQPEGLSVEIMFKRAMERLKDRYEKVKAPQGVPLTDVLAAGARAAEMRRVDIRGKEMEHVRAALAEAFRPFRNDPKEVAYVLASAARDWARSGEPRLKEERVQEFLASFKEEYPEPVRLASQIHDHFKDHSSGSDLLRSRAMAARKKIRQAASVSGALALGAIFLGMPDDPGLGEGRDYQRLWESLDGMMIEKRSTSERR